MHINYWKSYHQIYEYILRHIYQLGALLDRTSKRAIANYMMWRVVAESTNFLTRQLRQRQQDYAAALIGTQTEEPRWKHCIGIVTDKLPIAIASAYAAQYFDSNSKAIVQLMVDYIREEFKKLLKSITWMDETTKRVAFVKADKMVAHIGYPDELLDEKKIIEYYKRVDIDASKYFQSMLSMKVFEADLEYKKLRMAVNKTDWESHSKIAEVNAAYSRTQNSISELQKWKFFVIGFCSHTRKFFSNCKKISV